MDFRGPVAINLMCNSINMPLLPSIRCYLSALFFSVENFALFNYKQRLSLRRPMIYFIVSGISVRFTCYRNSREKITTTSGIINIYRIVYIKAFGRNIQLLKKVLISCRKRYKSLWKPEIMI